MRMKNCLPMKPKQLTALLAGLLVLASGVGALRAAEAEGVALAIVYDTSGSMKEPVTDANGRKSPKYVVANRALDGITRQLQAFMTNTTAGPRQVSAALVVFTSEGARVAVPFGPFNAQSFYTWGKTFNRPEGGTPLGRALSKASEVVLDSGLSRKHVLIITDGMNTVGPDPASVLPGIRAKAADKGAAVSVHFVAFDVDAAQFAGVKKLDATVVSAANETQLNTQLQFILQKKILLEEEEPPTKSK
jgi:uncharacterized protein YegL